MKKYDWVGPESEIGVCDDCAQHNNVNKVPVRRLIPEDNIYLCKTHWEECRLSEDVDGIIEMEPFLRVVS